MSEANSPDPQSPLFIHPQTLARDNKVCPVSLCEQNLFYKLINGIYYGIPA